MADKKIIRPLYSIGTVARLTGVSTHSLRAWDRRYGLSASQRDDAGRRVYSQADLDHISLIKQLLDDGVKIGDIARLPSDTLRLMAQDSKSDSSDKKTLVVGTEACRLIDNHQIRFRGYHCELYPLASAADLTTLTLDTNKAWVLIFEIESLSNSIVEHITQIVADSEAQNHLLIYRYASHSMIDTLQQQRVKCLRAAVNIDLIVDELDAFNASVENYKEEDLRSAPKRYFSDEQLAEVVENYTRPDCACPTHISELIRSLSAFEDYCLTCETEHEEDARLHSSMFAHTSKARHLMERALQVLIEHHA